MVMPRAQYKVFGVTAEPERRGLVAVRRSRASRAVPSHVSRVYSIICKARNFMSENKDSITRGAVPYRDPAPRAIPGVTLVLPWLSPRAQPLALSLSPPASFLDVSRHSPT